MFLKKLNKKGEGGGSWGIRKVAAIIFIVIVVVAIIILYIWSRDQGYSIFEGFKKIIENIFLSL